MAEYSDFSNYRSSVWQGCSVRLLGCRNEVWNLSTSTPSWGSNSKLELRGGAIFGAQHFANESCGEVVYYAAQSNWYAVQTRSRQEKKLLRELECDGFTSFLPLLNRVSCWSDRQKIIQEPLFPGYLFRADRLDTGEQKCSFEKAWSGSISWFEGYWNSNPGQGD